VADTTTTDRRSLIRTAVIVAILALALAGLSGLYYLLTRAPKLDSAQGGAKDRNFLFSIYGFEGDLLRRPTGVAFDGQGNIYVADTGKRRVLVFDGSGRYVTTFAGEPGKGAKQVWQPIAVAVGPDGRSYVIDKGLNKMVIYDARHVATGEVTFPEAPTGVTVSGTNLFVTTRSGVVIGDLDGKFVTGYVRWGKGDGEFDMPGNVAVGKDGTLYVADSLNYRVQAISKTGKVLWTYGKPIPADQAVMYNGADRKFGLPSSIAVDDNGYIYVVDGLSSEVDILDSKGAFIEKMGDVGHADGTFYYPDGIAYSNGRLAIADKFNDRVEVFSAPMSPTVGDRVSLNAAWGLLLLLPLLLVPWLLLRRQSRYVITPSFLAALEADGDARADVVRMLKRVSASEPFAAVHGKDVEGLRMIAHKPTETEIAELSERYSLDADAAQALAVARKLKGKAALLVNDEPLLLAAEDLGLTSLTYREVRDAVKVDVPAQSAEGDA
jgi:DNA-binding beta-propeller fold protein YncE